METIRVLIVDDDAAHGEWMCNALKKLGATVSVASTMEQAFSVLLRGDIDLILLDVFLLPGKPNYDSSLSIAAASAARGIPYVLISNLADWRIVERFERAGCLDFIEKRSSGDLLDESRLAHLLETVRPDESAPWRAAGLIGHSRAIQQLWSQIKSAAAGDEPVLITGPTGSGKELTARAIHKLSPRSKHEPLVLNCASLPDGLVEAELFGFVKGCFTGASQSLPGWFEAANGSSLILDEVGDLSRSAQAKVLRALDAGEIQKIGDRALHAPDVRLLFITQREPAELQEQGKLREDFRFRLENSHRVVVPPLKDHKEDIPALLSHFIKPDVPLEISPRAQERLFDHTWPGNIRELKGLAMRIRARLVARNSWTVELGDVSGISADEIIATKPNEAVESAITGGPAGSRYAWSAIVNALIRNRGHRENTAADLQVDRKTLTNWRKQAPPEVLDELVRHGILW